jgi:DNA polymerase V
MQKKKYSEIEFLHPDFGTELAIPFFDATVPAGFPSPAGDYTENKIDLNKYVIRNPSSTFMVRVKGDSMVDANISTGDILVVDKSLKAKDGDIVVGILDGEFTVKTLRKKGKEIMLMPANSKYEPISVSGDMNFEVWGVVTFTIKQHYK